MMHGNLCVGDGSRAGPRGLQQDPHAGAVYPRRLGHRQDEGRLVESLTVVSYANEDLM